MTSKHVPSAFSASVFCLATLALLTFTRTAPAADAKADAEAGVVFSGAVDKLLGLVEPAPGQAGQTLSAKIKVVKAEGLPREAQDATAAVALQAPDRLWVTATFGGDTYAAAQNGQEVWFHQPGKKFALLAKNGVPRFKADPSSVQDATLPPLRLPISRLKIKLALMAVRAEHGGPAEKVGADKCHVLNLTVAPTAAALVGGVASEVRAKLWVRQADLLPVRLTFTDGNAVDVQIDATDVSLSAPWPDDKWALKPNKGDHVETVALTHLVKFMEVAPKLTNQDIPTLGPATGRREVIARSGNGRLEMIDGTRVLFLKGSPEEMGRQHGELLKPQIRDVAEKILYGVGVGSSFAKGNWFFGEIEGAQARLLPHMNEKYLREADAIAAAVGMHPQEARMANFFPELFHCSGFALMNSATKDGHVYHGRVLDYMKGVGLEQNAVVIVHQPDYGHAWVNVTYAGFVGTVTAMNEKGISIGEMGGGGYGKWDGKPMAHLLREVMEKATTLDEAVAIMRNSPRTCEYYYVISDGKSKKAVGIAATPEKFETVKPGESHPLLPQAVKDAVLLSAGDRYEALVRRVQQGHGKFEAESAIKLMSRPVCMTSNIHSVLFRPDTLDLWVANADSRNPASHTRFTHYNLKDLLGGGQAGAGF
jgi:isopenicillin-N N-acyltransferase-like protein